MFSVLLIAMQGESDAALNRFAGYMKGLDAMSVKMKITADGSPITGDGTLKFQKPERLLYTVKAGTIDYSFSLSEEGILEIERGIKKYSQFGRVGRLVVPQSKISALPSRI
ncbi:MAG TPA: hypothetical protein VM328_04160, partial [Fimbriimonadaceae bacterium]|nr:hypothetical protein [Fimbriimonadaceae bacterium]